MMIWVELDMDIAILVLEDMYRIIFHNSERKAQRQADLDGSRLCVYSLRIAQIRAWLI